MPSGDSPRAGLDPRLKVAGVACASLLAVVLDSPPTLLALGAGGVASLLAAGLGRRALWAALAGGAAIAWSTVLSQALFYGAEPRTPVAVLLPAFEAAGIRFPGLAVWKEGALHGAVQALRIGNSSLAAAVRLGYPMEPNGPSGLVSTRWGAGDPAWRGGPGRGAVQDAAAWDWLWAQDSLLRPGTGGTSGRSSDSDPVVPCGEGRGGRAGAGRTGARDVGRETVVCPGAPCRWDEAWLPGCAPGHLLRQGDGANPILLLPGWPR